MADPVTTPGETPNQPAVETPPAAASAQAPAPKAADPAPKPAAEPKTDPTPAASAAPSPDKPAADTASADAAAKAQTSKDVPDAADPAKATPDPATPAAEIVYEIKAPEGMQVDPALLPALTPALKKAGLTQEQFQTIADAFTEFQKGVAPRMLERDLAAVTKDKDLGGMRYARTLKEVNTALEAFGDPDFKKFVLQAGIANRLEFVRVFQRIGEAMMKAGDVPVRGEPDAAPETTRAQRMYGRSPKPT